MIQRTIVVLKTIKYVLHYIYMLVVLFGLIMVVVWSLDNTFPRLVLSGTLTPARVNPGDVVHVEWIVKGLRHCPGVVIRSLEDECGSHLLYDGPIANPYLPLNQESTIVLNFQVPKTVTSGRCEFHTTLKQYCNPLHYVFPLKVNLKLLVFYVDSKVVPKAKDSGH